MRSTLAIGAAFAAFLSTTASSRAATVGSASLATHRSCAITAANENCDGLGPGQRIATSRYGGGLGIGGTNALFIPGGNQAWSTVSFDPATDLPIIKGYTSAPGDLRMNINTFAFQSYTYTGLVATPFSITSNLHIADSSTNPSGRALPGGAGYTNYIAIWDPAILGGLTSAEDLFDALFLAPCGTRGVFGVNQISFAPLPGGSFTSTLTTTACAPGSLLLAPGQEVLVVAALQLPVNRGGFVDATSTFTTRLGDDLSPDEKARLQSSLLSAIDQGQLVALPEPATWTLMISGFAIAGGAMRRRNPPLYGVGGKCGRNALARAQLTRNRNRPLRLLVLRPGFHNQE